jgi:hypothetical protein
MRASTIILTGIPIVAVAALSIAPAGLAIRRLDIARVVRERSM